MTSDQAAQLLEIMHRMDRGQTIEIDFLLAIGLILLWTMLTRK